MQVSSKQKQEVLITFFLYFCFLSLFLCQTTFRFLGSAGGPSLSPTVLMSRHFCVCSSLWPHPFVPTLLPAPHYPHSGSSGYLSHSCFEPPPSCFFKKCYFLICQGSGRVVWCGACLPCLPPRPPLLAARRGGLRHPLPTHSVLLPLPRAFLFSLTLIAWSHCLN